MENNKVVGTDGFPIELFKDFYELNLDIKRINCSIVTQLPKTNEVVKIQQFRSICLLN
jgi:hypothetical protein